MKFLTQNNLLMRLSSKVVVTVGLLFVLFAPTMQMFITPVGIPFAHADVVSDCTSGGGTWVPAGAFSSGYCNPSPNQQVSQSFDALGTSSCSWSPGTWGTCFALVIYVFTVGLGSTLAFVGAYFFDITVNLSLNSYAYALTFISQGWTAVRDIANMAFILILVYIAYIILLEAEGAGTMQMLAWVIFIALIINFSFFLTRTVIDAGNIVAVQFYNAMPPVTLQSALGLGGTGGGTAAGAVISTVSSNSSLANTKDLTYNIMQGLNLQSAFSTGSFQQFQTGSGFFTQFLILSFLYICLGAFFFMLAAMLIGAGIKFMFRIVMLWFAIIVAPLALVAKAIPKQGVYFDRWLKMLIQNTFYPAIFLFILILISNLMAAMNANGGVVGNIFNSLAAISGNQNIGGITYVAVAVGAIAIRMGILLAMLYVAMKASDTVSSYGAGMAHKVTSWATGQTGRAVSATTGWAGRRSLGWAGNQLARNPNLNAAANQRGLQGEPARLALGLSKRLGSATYDLRNAPGSGLVKKGAEKLLGPINTGKAATEGYVQQRKAEQERIEKERKERMQIIRDSENKKSLARLAELTEKEKTTPLTPAENAEKASATDKMKNFSKREVESFKLGAIEKVLKHVNKDMMKKVEDSDKFSDKEKEDLRTKWHEEATDAPLQKSQKIIEELRTIHGDLTKVGSGIAAAAVAPLATHSTAGATINTVNMGDVLKSVNDELAATRARRDTTSNPVDKRREGINITNLERAKGKLEDLNKERKDIPPTAGGAPNSGEFVVK